LKSTPSSTPASTAEPELADQTRKYDNFVSEKKYRKMSGSDLEVISSKRKLDVGRILHVLELTIWNYI
jgi:hypothetical protein